MLARIRGSATSKQEKRRLFRGSVVIAVFAFVVATCSGTEYRTSQLTPITPEQRFVDKCSRSLVVKKSLGDQRISQTEYTNYLIQHCLEEQPLQYCSPSQIQQQRNNNVNITFHSLNQDLQTLFIDIACGLNQEECPRDEYGLIVDPDNIATIDHRVYQLCLGTYFILQKDQSLFNDIVDASENSTIIVEPSSMMPSTTTTETKEPTFYPTTSPTFYPTISPAPSLPIINSPTSSPTTPTPTIPPIRTVAPTSTVTASEKTRPEENSVGNGNNDGNEENAITPEFTPSGTENDWLVSNQQQASAASDAGESSNVSTAAVLGIVSAIAIIGFCIGVMYYGGHHLPDYDMNKPLSTSERERYMNGKEKRIYTREDDDDSKDDDRFHDEEDYGTDAMDTDLKSSSRRSALEEHLNDGSKRSTSRSKEGHFA